MGRNWPPLLLVHRDTCSALVERYTVTRPTEALMEVAQCAAILTEPFMQKLPLFLLVHVVQFAFLFVVHPILQSPHRLVCSRTTSPSRV